MLHDVNNNLEDETKLFELQNEDETFAVQMSLESSLERDLDNAIMNIQINLLQGRI